MHQLNLIGSMDSGEEGFLLLRQIWRQRTGEEPVNAAYMWRRDNLDVWYKLSILVFLIMVFIGGCVITIASMQKSILSTVNERVIIIFTLGALGFGIKTTVTLIEHLLRRKSAFGTAVEDLADALNVSLGTLKFIEKEGLDILVNKFYTEGNEKMTANQSFEARGTKETTYSLSLKRYLRHRPAVEKFS